MFEDRGLIDDLAAPHRASPAFKRLMARGQAALPAVLGGLAHASAEETKFATAAAVTAAILGGAHIVRVHDVREMRAAADVADEIIRTQRD